MARTLEVKKEDWPLAKPFRITGRTWNSLEAIHVTIRENGYVGHAEAAGIYYQGETQDSMIRQVLSVAKDIEQGASREDLLQLLPVGGARNALDCALWDLEAKLSRRSIFDLTARSSKPLTTVFTVGIEEDPLEMAEKAQRKSDFPILKVKLDAVKPVERIEAIRRARPDATLVIDANQGFTIDHLREVLPAFKDQGVAMLEQPLPRGEDHALDGFKSPIPLCADESVLDREELAAALSRYDMINIKLDKCGGLTEALHLQREVRRNGKACMIGNMFGTSLAMAPAFVVGQDCRFVDLDGPMHLARDRKGGMDFDSSRISMGAGCLWGAAEN